MLWHLEKVGDLWFPTPAKRSGWKTVKEKDSNFAAEMKRGYAKWADGNSAVQKAQEYCGLQSGG